MKNLFLSGALFAAGILFSLTLSSFAFSPGSPPAIRILPGGNVGIGTDTPEEKLHIDGNIRLDGNRTIIDGFDGANNHWMKANGPGTEIENAFLGFNVDSEGKAKHVLISPRGATGMIIASSDRVGIGTHFPEQKLHVQGSGDTRIRIGSNTASGVLEIASGNETNYVFTDQNGDLYLRTDDPVKDVLLQAGNNSGRVGVGTTDPHANFRMQIKGGGGAWKGGLAAGGDTTAVVIGELYGKSTLGGHNAALSAWGDLLINPVSGNVGIGTTTPVKKLAIATATSNDGIWVAGNADQNISLLTNNGAGSFNPITQAGDRVLLYSGASVGNPGGGLVIAPWSGATSGIRLDESGNVGIGTSNPGALLHVNGQLLAGINGGGRHLVINDIATARWGLATGGYNLSFENDNADGSWSTRFRLEQNGNAWLQGSLTQASDKKLKKNIRPLANALNKVTNLRGVSYEWKNDPQLQGTQIGLIAQEVEQQFPEFVFTSADGYKSVDYIGLIAPMIEAIKELKYNQQERETQISELKSEIELLREQLSAL